jgi:DNA-directed RNA polymerase subunit M/transcription elongation factor TFIIS
MKKCPLCGYELEEETDQTREADWYAFQCRNCGYFEVSSKGLSYLRTLESNHKKSLTTLSYAVRKMNLGLTKYPVLSLDMIKKILETTELPRPMEQVQNLLLWVADKTEFGERFYVEPRTNSAIVGTANSDGLVAAAKALREMGYAHGDIVGGSDFDGELTLKGWLAADEMRRGRPDSRKAFMAMKYGDTKLDAVFAECFRPAVEATGFSLRRLDEAPPAGLIDDRLRVEIRTSRFVVVDLTGGNQGAYWEAGFAEGIGRPVIYTCEKGYFEEYGIHFDAEHQHTILWEHDNLAAAAEDLKMTIRATLPAEAVLQDAPDGHPSEPPARAVPRMGDAREEVEH